MFIVIFQVGGSVIFIFGTWWRWFTAAAFGAGQPSEMTPGMDPEGKILDTDDEDDVSDFEVAIQPSNARYVATQRQVPSSDEIDSATDSGSYTPTSDGSGMHRRRGNSPRYVD